MVKISSGTVITHYNKYLAETQLKAGNLQDKTLAKIEKYRTKTGKDVFCLFQNYLTRANFESQILPLL